MFRHIRAVSLFLGFLIAASSEGATFTFSTGNPNGVIAVASRPDGGGGLFEIEAADDFVTLSTTTINHATFTGLIPTGTLLTSVSQVVVEIYRVFPQDSNTVRTPLVPTRVNSPSDVAFDFRDSTVPNLTFAASILAGSFTASNSISPGAIHPLPNQTTGGSGPTTGQEVLFDVTFTTPFTLPAGHYFFVPQVSISGGGVFYWLSAPKPIVAPGTPFAPDLQSWTRDAFLDPDWLRVGTDIVGGTTPPTFNGAFSLDGVVANSLVVTPVAIAPFEAVSFSGTVASFIDADTLQPPGNFTATVDWGDGTTSAGTVTGSAGSFSVSGTHTYADEGSFPVQVTVIDITNSLSASSTGTATVGESDVLAGTGLAITATQGVAFTGAVASFTDTDAANVPVDFTATIHWGDTTTTAGVVSGGSGTFLVSGSHTYAGAGTFPVTVTLSDDAPGTATATAVGSASVAAAPVNANASAVPTLGGLGLLILTLSLAAFGALMTRSR